MHPRNSSSQWFLRGALLSASDQGVISLTRFLLALFLARVLPPDEFGGYVLCFSVLLFISALQSALFTEPLSIFGPSSSKVEIRSYVSGTAVSHATFAIISGLTLVGLSRIGVFGHALGSTLFGLGLGVPVIQSQSFARSLLFMRERPGAVLMNDLLWCSLQSILVAALYATSMLSSASVFPAMAIAACPSMLIGFFQSRELISLPRVPIRASLEKNWKLGRWLLNTTLAQWASSQVHLFVAAVLLGASAAGILRACQVLLAPTHMLLIGLDALLSPIASRRYAQEGASGLEAVLRGLGILLGLTVGGYAVVAFVFAEPLLGLSYRGVYAGYGGLVGLFGLEYTLYACSRPLVIRLKVTQRARVLSYSYLFSSVLSLIAVVPLIRTWGIYGAAVGSSLAMAIFLTSLLLRSWQRSRLDLLYQSTVDSSPGSL